MKNYVYIATSIDGYIATLSGGLDWLENIPNPDESDFGYNDFIKRIDAIVMGKNTFKKVLSFESWPYNKKVFVLSNSIKSIPKELSNKVEVISGYIPDIVTKLNNDGYLNLYIDGGKTIQSFLKYDLIDEMIITRASLLLGSGIPLFNTLDSSINFAIKETNFLNEHLIQTHYVRKRV